MKRALLSILAFCLLITFSLPVFSSEVQDPIVSDATVGVYGGTLISTLLGDPKTFNPVIAKETSSTDITNFIFEGLIERDGVTTEIQPLLARDWEISDDGLVWTFYLRRGVTFTDGVELTADDVIFTLDVIYDEDVPASARNNLMIAGKPLQYEKIDDYTIKFTLPETFGPMLNQMGFDILPKHILYEPWQEGRFNEMWGIDTPPTEIIGTGPFYLGDYRPSQRVVMLRNSAYWKENLDGGALPYITRWVREIVEDQEAMALKFEAGEITYTSLRPEDFFRFDDEMKMERENYSLYDGGPTFSTLFITLNQNPDAPIMEQRPEIYDWFTDIEFRRALAYAMDKDAMIDLIYEGLAEPQWSLISAPNQAYLVDYFIPYEPDPKEQAAAFAAEGLTLADDGRAYDEDGHEAFFVYTYPYNLDKAQEILANAGYVKGDDGVLRDSQGRTVSFEVATNAGNLVREMTVNMMEEDFNQLGMQVSAVPKDFNLLVTQLTSTFDWEAIVIGLTGGVEPHAGGNVWRSEGTLHMWNPMQDEPKYDWEARIDELYDLGAFEIETADRRPYYAEAQRIVSEELPLIYTVTQNSLAAIRNTLQNVEYTAYGGVTHNIEELYFTQ